MKNAKPIRSVAPPSETIRIDAARERYTREREKPAAINAFANAVMERDPAHALHLLEKGLAITPRSASLLTTKLSVICGMNDASTMAAVLDELETLEQPAPYWVERMIEGRREGFFEVGYGVRLPYDPELISPWIARYLALGNYESQEATILAEHLDPADRVLDLGAGLGLMGCIVGKTMPPAVYRGYEANPELAPLIERTKALNDLDLDIRSGAVGRQDGTATFHIDERFWSSSFTARETTIRSVSVPVVDFAAMLKEFSPTFLVMDIEGAEYDILDYSNWKSVRKVLVETHPHKVADERHRAGLMALFKRGFLPSGQSSKGRVLYLYR